jgi:voltage-gated potassium channel
MQNSYKRKLYDIIFKADTPAGKAFDVALLIAILLSVGIVLIESVEQYSRAFTKLFIYAEWVFTILFTAEYIIRIAITPSKRKYIFSFFGIIDFLSILPAYLSLVFTGVHSLIILRSFRLLRVFRIFKLARFMGEASQLRKALSASRAKIIVFLVTVGIVVVIMGTVMYLVEGSENGFTSIPKSIYWAIVTLTTVGYGDVAPSTVLGQTLASIIMIMGYGIIAVPTGIVTAEMARANRGSADKSRICPSCKSTIFDEDALYCKYCGETME